jgi:DNA-binding NarL/FixJ family response regulator
MYFLIADDHPIFRSGLNSFLKNTFPTAEITECDNGLDAEKEILSNSPDFALLDIDMPQKSGLDICKELIRKTATKLIILTMYNDGEMLKKALNNGADAYLVKDNTTDELGECIETLSEGVSYIAKSMRKSPKVQQQLKNYNNLIEKLNGLTETELKTLKLVAQKYSSKEIADLLFVSSKYVENYRSRICKKIDLDTSTKKLVVWAIEHEHIIKDIG